ncbi:Elongation factor TFIIS 2 [Glarea lozoyensis ATCC 20868]|uniref:Transcription elongation factor n=1 Tax=Glarea lozoyensis (strain ATCC 20868 / MF5171) TaxID=1116229 RepID=S3CDB0_GLAL2|nr:Elongation factor TFIIS 2 [Glarea lozoyensis ATCC 20868]EPE24522.1 Elongation factor TFIIS 2 [Glarea lozoyensis ATCC 20868]
MATGMAQRELESQLKALLKVVGDKDSAPAAITILETLKRDVKPTEELLRATKAGMIVAKQKGNQNKDIARLAAEVIGKWKRAVQIQQAEAKKQKMSGSSPPKAEATSSPAPASKGDKYTGDVSKRRWETDKVDTKRTGVPTRDACIGLIYNGLAFMSDASPTQVIAKAMEVEKAAYESHKGDNSDYRAKLRSLFQNLKNKDNRELGIQVLSGDILPSKFVVMTHDELKSAKRIEEDKKLNYENMKMAQVPMAEKSISDALRCGRCGQKKVSYSQAQTRSADEPMTTFCECTVCGNRWKFS